MTEIQIDGAYEDDFGILVRSRAKVVAALGSVAEAATQTALIEAISCADSRTLFPVLLPTGPALGVLLSWKDIEVAFVRPANVDATLVDFVVSVPFAFEILEQILNDPYRALTVADHTASMLYVSPVHEKFLGWPHGGTRGLPAEQAIPNSRLRAVIESGKAEIGKAHKLSDGVTRVVTRRPVWKNKKVIGAVGGVMFRDAEAVSQMAGEINQLRSQVEFYRRELSDLRTRSEAMVDLVGDSQAMQRLRDEIAKVARLDVPVLIIGESGTGKELVAQAIHRLGRPSQSMVSMNLAALPTSLVEAELFGHVAGAFTGSSRQGRPGKLEMANDGTLFLDEVGDIPADIQIKLLRVLEDHIVERLGSHKSQHAAFRLVSATHRNMEELIRTGVFRHDLFYRISGFILRVPPLRQRLEDIPALVAHFVSEFCERNSWPAITVTPDVSRYLAQQEWPGNLRQLRHRVEEAMVFSGPGSLALETFTRNDAARRDAASVLIPNLSDSLHLQPSETMAPDASLDLKGIGRVAALKAVDAHGGNKQRAARHLGISRSYLYNLLR